MPRMKLKFETVFRFYVLSLSLLLVWSVWRAGAQTGSPEATASVRIVDPANGAHFDPGTNIELRATVGGGFAPNRLDFMLNGRVLGTAVNAPYSMVWSNVPAGSHQLVARAVSETGTSLDSPSINVRVYVAPLTFGLDDVAFLREHRLFDEALWKYAASLIYILLAFYLSKLLDWIVNSWLKRLAAKTETK